MKKWYDEEYRWIIEVIGYLRGDGPERVCRNGEEVGDVYTCTYGCPVNAEGQGICSKVMMVLFPVMEAVRSGGDLQNIGGSGQYTKEIVCPDAGFMNEERRKASKKASPQGMLFCLHRKAKR